MRREYFSFTAETDEFDEALTSLIGNLTQLERAKIISPENVMRYNHGIRWVSVSSDSSEEENEMSIHSTETIISMQDIREHNLAALPSFLKDITQKMINSVKRMMYQTISDSCDKSGNTISAKDYETSADAFLATIKKVEFGVDKHGNISRPEFHVAPGVYEKLKKETEEKGQGFQNEVDKVIEEKSQAALKRENKRLARFKKQ